MKKYLMVAAVAVVGLSLQARDCPSGATKRCTSPAAYMAPRAGMTGPWFERVDGALKKCYCLQSLSEHHKTSTQNVVAGVAHFPYSKVGYQFSSQKNERCIFFPNSGIGGNGLLACPDHAKPGQWTLRHTQSQCVTGTPLSGQLLGSYKNPIYKGRIGTARSCSVHEVMDEIAPGHGHQFTSAKNERSVFFPRTGHTGVGLVMHPNRQKKDEWLLSHAESGCAGAPLQGEALGSYKNPAYKATGMLGGPRSECSVHELMMG